MMPSQAILQERLTGLFDWLVDKDPVRAARLLADYLADLAEEQSSASVGLAEGRCLHSGQASAGGTTLAR